MKIEVIPVGQLEVNCYIASCPETKEAVVIDPGDEAHFVEQYVEKEGLTVKYIINTHGHYDHIGANMDLKAKTGAPVMIHTEDNEMLMDPSKSLSQMFGHMDGIDGAEILLRTKDEIKFGNQTLQVIHTPGHTKGGCCFYSPEAKVCFTGDTLFAGTIGRTDLYGGDYPQLLKSVKDKLAKVSDETVIYPGHGASSTMAKERRVNPYVK